MAVEGVEITQVEVHLLAQMQANARANRVRIGHKRLVVHVFFRQTIARVLPTCTHG